MGDLTDGLIEHIALLNVNAVESNDLAATYFVSAKLSGAGFDGDTDVATWATDSLTGNGEIYSVSELAIEHSIWPRLRSMADDGAQESADCTRS